MDRKKKILIAKSVAILSIVPVLIYAHVAGPDPGKTGVPGESTCAESGCHTGAGLNAGGGSVRIDAGGTAYQPGVRQRIKVTVTDPAQRKWGFQLTARQAANEKLRAGILAPANSSTQIICSNANTLEVPCNANPVLQFIEHTLAGSRLTAVGEGQTFEFDWTPPATDVGPIILYAAGNASNANMLETGDNIYTTTLTLTVGGGGGGGEKPTITRVVNGASFNAAGSSSVVAPGSVISIYGSGLASGLSISDSVPVSTKLGDVDSVTIGGTAAPLLFVSDGRINAQVPWGVTPGQANVVVNRAGVASEPMAIQVNQFAPALFSLNLGTLQAIATNSDGSIVGPAGSIPGVSSHPATAGDTITLFATGLGPVDPAIADGALAPADAARLTTNPVTVLIGGMPGAVSSAGLSTQFVGVYQLSVVVPAGVTPGGAVAVQAQVGGVNSTDPVTIALQ